jgi:hypothetical protein
MRKITAIFLLAFVLLLVAQPLAAAGSDEQQIRFQGRVRWVESLGTYALLADDGKKYHPIKQLPRAYQQPDLAVVVVGLLRPDLVGARMYGPALEVQQIVKAGKYVSAEEWEAIRLLLQRMEAFNTGDLTKLQAIDPLALKLSRDQFDAWLAGWGKFTLHYVEASVISAPRPAAPTIEGICLYSRERVNSMALSGNTQYAVMKFTLAKNNGKWQFAAAETVQPDPGTDLDAVVSGYLDRARERFGTTDLAKAKN